MDDGRVTLNCGGRVFETTALTLKTSGAGYFEALLGETGARLPGSKKRARVSEDGDDAAGHRELFIDRDPDRFADVLSFMRTDRLPAAAAKDLDRLQDLKTEAEFLAYDALLNACDAAEAALAAAAALAAPVPSKESAEMKIFYVYGGETTNEEEGPEWGQEVRIRIPKGQVLCITQMLPIPVNDDEQWLLRAHTYGPSGVKSAVIGQYYIKNIGGLKEFLQHDTMLVLDGGESNELVLDANGTKWSIVAWLGHPSKIPGLSSPRN